MTAIIEWFTESLVGRILTTVGVSMVPVVELRGALPIGVGLGLDIWTSFFASIIGNMIPIPFILLFIMKIFDWMRKRNNWMGRVADKMLSVADKKRSTVDKYGWIGLCIIVAIPLPGTGAWTGALVAGVLRLPFWKAIAAIFAGVIIAGIIVLLVTYGVVAII